MKRKSSEMDSNWQLHDISDMFSSFTQDIPDDMDDFDMPDNGQGIIYNGIV